MTGPDETPPVALDQLLGAWSLLSFTAVFDNGDPDVLLMGEDPSGLICYTPDGHMAALLTPRVRTPFASDVITDGSPDEYARAARTSVAYAGSFTFDAAAATLVHHVEVSVFPNWVGGDQVRQVSLDGDLLRLTSTGDDPGASSPSVHHLTWRRLG